MLKRIVSLMLAALFLAGLAACGDEPDTPDNTTESSADVPFTEVEYAASLKLDRSSSTAKAEVTVKNFVDGDTVHFYVPEDLIGSGVLKARFLAIDTPESTGKIEPWGKKASKFTREKLEGATSIIIESDDENWNLDSTGARHLVWVWYKTDEMSDYRNLNLEILQAGLCNASATGSNRYGSICLDALNQARKMKLCVFSGEEDPDFYYGDAVELSLVELRPNVEAYLDTKVAFEGVITRNEGNSVFVEEYDPDTDMYFGMSVYYGTGLSGKGLEILSVGNRVRIVGTVQYYEVGGVYQVSGLQYRQMKPDDPSNIQLISSGHEPAFVLTSPEVFDGEKVTLTLADGTEKSFDYAYLALSTTISMENLKVTDIYTTENPDSSSMGAMTLTCMAGETTIWVRTTVFRDESGALITEEAYKDATIHVRGIVDYYDGTYQILVLTPKDITIISEG